MAVSSSTPLFCLEAFVVRCSCRHGTCSDRLAMPCIDRGCRHTSFSHRRLFSLMVCRPWSFISTINRPRNTDTTAEHTLCYDTLWDNIFCSVCLYFLFFLISSIKRSKMTESCLSSVLRCFPRRWHICFQGTLPARHRRSLRSSSSFKVHNNS